MKAKRNESQVEHETSVVPHQPSAAASVTEPPTQVDVSLDIIFLK